MKGKANVHIDHERTKSTYVGIKTGSNMNSATVQSTTYDVYKVCILKRLWAQYRKSPLLNTECQHGHIPQRASPSVRRIEDNTLTHEHDG